MCSFNSSTDLTFIVASDPHFRYLSDESPNTATVISMNNLVSMPYPPEVGGVVDKPAFVIMTGDLADDPPDWSAPDGFLVHYGFDGTDGMVNCPVYITRGNHDMYPEMKTWITARHGGVYYSFDRNGIHFVCMDVYPTTVIADWLRDDLAGLADADTPIILYQHYAPSYSGAIMDVIHGYNILALFHGHEHESYHSVYNDPGSDGQYDIFSVGSPVKGNSHYFYVVHIDDGRMDVVENSCFQAGQWRNYYTKILAQFPSITFDNAIDTFIASGVPDGDYSIRTGRSDASK